MTSRKELDHRRVARAMQQIRDESYQRRRDREMAMTAPPYPVSVSVDYFTPADESASLPTHKLTPLKRWELEQDVILAAMVAVSGGDLASLVKAVKKLKADYAPDSLA